MLIARRLFPMVRVEDLQEPTGSILGEGKDFLYF